MTSLQITVINNIGSIILGVIACALACFAISRKQAHCYSVASFSFCALSLLLQFFEIDNRVNAGDFAAVADTIRAVTFAAVVLVGTTVALNVIALKKVNKSKTQTERRQENEQNAESTEGYNKGKSRSCACARNLPHACGYDQRNECARNGCGGYGCSALFKHRNLRTAQGNPRQGAYSLLHRAYRRLCNTISFKIFSGICRNKLSSL